MLYGHKYTEWLHFQSVSIEILAFKTHQRAHTSFKHKSHQNTAECPTHTTLACLIILLEKLKTPRLSAHPLKPSRNHGSLDPSESATGLANLAAVRVSQSQDMHVTLFVRRNLNLGHHWGIARVCFHWRERHKKIQRRKKKITRNMKLMQGQVQKEGSAGPGRKTNVITHWRYNSNTLSPVSPSQSISFPILITQAVLAQVAQDTVWREECSCTLACTPCGECKLHTGLLHKGAGRWNTNKYPEEEDRGEHRCT